MGTKFFNTVGELVTNFDELFVEAKNAFSDGRIPDNEFTAYEELYTDFLNDCSDLIIKEMSENQFLRSLFDVVKSFERIKNTVYTNSAWDLLADAYVELAEINLCRNNVQNV